MRIKIGFSFCVRALHAPAQSIETQKKYGAMKRDIYVHTRKRCL